MPNSLAQIWAIARCEFLVHWRRRGLKVMLFSYLVMQGFFFLLASEGNPLGFPAAEIWRYNTGVVISGTWLIAGAFLLVMFPFVVAEAVPRDRQFGVRELLDSLPLPRPVYLAGKVLGAWIGVASAALSVMALAGIVWRFIVGPYSTGHFLAILLIGANLLILLNCSLTVLAAAGQPNVVRALLVGLACIIILPIVLLQFDSTSPLQLLNPLRPSILYYYVSGPSPSEIAPFGERLGIAAALALPATLRPPTPHYYYLGGTNLPQIVWFGEKLSAAAAFALTVAGGLLELIVAGVLALYSGSGNDIVGRTNEIRPNGFMRKKSKPIPEHRYTGRPGGEK